MKELFRVRLYVIALLPVLFSTGAKGQIMADHTVVDLYQEIPQQYIDSVKKMLVCMGGESHSGAYRAGQALLEFLDPRFQTETFADELPPAYSDQYLRIGTPFQVTERTFFSRDYIDVMKSHITEQNDMGNPYDIMGFAWCWDMSWENPPGGGVDPVYNVRWAGSSLGGPDGDQRWGLDAGDSILTGNRICMDTYLQAIEDYNQFCMDNGYPTRWIFTTGPVDRDAGSENGFQREIKHDYIRDYVRADPSRILFDYADILCWSDSGDQYISDWDTGEGIRSHVSIHPDNQRDFDDSGNIVAMTDADQDHIGEVGALRIAKATWWILARIAGWEGNIPVTEISISAQDDPLEVMTGDTVLFSAEVLPATADDSTIIWNILEETGTARISAEGEFLSFLPGTVRVIALAGDGSGVSDTLVVNILPPAVPVTSILVSARGDSTSVGIADTLRFFEEVLPQNASCRSVDWQVVPGTGSAQISQEGLLTGESPGTVEVKAIALDGSGAEGILDILVVSVLVPISDVHVRSAGDITELESGSSLQFYADVQPPDADNPEIQWSVLNGGGTAAITGLGLLTAGSPGIVSVVARSLGNLEVADTFLLNIIPPLVPVSSIQLTSNGGVTSVESGQTLQFSASVLPGDASNQEVDWSIVNGTGSAAISGTGLLTAGNPGTVSVVVHAQDGSGVQSDFLLTITAPGVMVSSITIYPAMDVTSIESGQNLQFTASVLPQDASNKVVGWSVVNGTGTASISAQGLLTAGNPGTVSVVARAQDGSGVQTNFQLMIFIPDMLVSEIQINSPGGVTTLASGQALQFSATVLPENASSKDVSWSVVNGTGTATISAQGLLAAGNPGTVSVLASATDGSGVQSNFLLTITAPTELVSSITISTSGGITVLESGQTLLFYVTVLPENASNKLVDWTIINNTGTASISEQGLVTGLNPGTITVVADARDGSGVTASYELIIETPEIEVTGIEISAAGGVTQVEEGEMLQLYASISPSDADNPTVYWHVSASKSSAGAGSITSDGMFIALGQGNVDVVAIAQDGSGVNDMMTISITGPSATADLKDESVLLYPNPGSGLFYLNAGEFELELVQVANTLGNLVLELVPDPGVKLIELDLSGQSTGLYFIKGKAGDQLIVRKVIVNR